MNRVKRWLLILAAVVIVLPNVQALKATALIFGRTPSTTASTTTTTTTGSISSEESEDVVSTDELEEEVTKPPLTGIPQIDYVWDPNLPRELNGFNLSTYPFLHSVPDNDDIDFKCDGLHDGFYASIKFGCQLYHHCIYGIRHDFLCANFTAFDQKTFICQFVSEVNCKNSAKYWFRNDALYRATTTTTTTTTTVAPPTTERQRRPMGRKPLRRRRPQNDYYYEDEEYEDDYAEERLNRRRKPPARNRYRPVYEDEYANERDYDVGEDAAEDDYDYEQRSTQSRNRNRPANNRRYRNRERNNRRNLNESRSSTRSQEDEPRSLGESRRPEPTRRYNRDRRPVQEDRERVADRDRDRDRNRYTTSNSNKRPLRNEEEEEPQIEFERPNRNYDETDEELPRRNNFRNKPSDKRVKGRTTPIPRDEFDDPPPRRKNVREQPREEVSIKVRSSANGASVYSRPRLPPKISRPVPIHEKQKFDYKKNESPSNPSNESDGKEDYYDEYEDEPIPEQKQQSKLEVKQPEKLLPKGVSSSRNSRPFSKEDFSRDEIIAEEEYDEVSVSDDADRVQNYNGKQIQKTEKEANVATTSRTIARSNKNSNNNSERSAITSASSIFQTEQQQKNREKFRNSFRSNTQPRPSTEEIPKEQSEVMADDRQKNDQKSITEQQNLRGKFRNNYRSNIKELRAPSIQTPASPDEEIEYTLSVPISSKQPIYASLRPQNSKFPPTAKDTSPQSVVEISLSEQPPIHDQNSNNQQSSDSLHEDVDERPVVRVVKRPFLPSRGGNPYLPRGLKPVGSSGEETYAFNRDQSNENIRQTEPVINLHSKGNTNYDQRQNFPGPLTTQPPQVEPPKDPLEQIYSEYDVTLNDALNPTLKPLVTSRGSPIGFSLNNKYEQQQYSYVPLNTATAQSRSSAVQVPYSDRKFRTPYIGDYEY